MDYDKQEKVFLELEYLPFPNLAEIFGVSPLVANKTRIHTKPAVNPDHRKCSPPFQPAANDASQGININIEKNSPTSATI